MKTIWEVGAGRSRGHSRLRAQIVDHLAPLSRSHLAVLGLLLCVLPASTLPAQALEAISLSGVNSAIGIGGPTTPIVKTSMHSGAQGDAAYAALRDFAQGLDAGQAAAATPAPADDAGDYGELRTYAAG